MQYGRRGLGRPTHLDEPRAEGGERHAGAYNHFLGGFIEENGPRALRRIDAEACVGGGEDVGTGEISLVLHGRHEGSIGEGGALCGGEQRGLSLVAQGVARREETVGNLPEGVGEEHGVVGRRAEGAQGLLHAPVQMLALLRRTTENLSGGTQKAVGEHEAIAVHSGNLKVVAARTVHGVAPPHAHQAVADEGQEAAARLPPALVIDDDLAALAVEQGEGGGGGVVANIGQRGIVGGAVAAVAHGAGAMAVDVEAQHLLQLAIKDVEARRVAHNLRHLPQRGAPVEAEGQPAFLGNVGPQVGSVEDGGHRHHGRSRPTRIVPGRGARQERYLKGLGQFLGQRAAPRQKGREG